MNNKQDISAAAGERPAVLFHSVATLGNCCLWLGSDVPFTNSNRKHVSFMNIVDEQTRDVYSVTSHQYIQLPLYNSDVFTDKSVGMRQQH